MLWESCGVFLFPFVNICKHPLVGRQCHLQFHVTHSQTEILSYSALLISHFSFTSFFVQVQAVFTASLNQGAQRKSKPLLGFLQSIKQYLQQTSSTLRAQKPGNKSWQSLYIPPPGSFSVSLPPGWFMAELLPRIAFSGYFLVHVSWQLHKKQERPWGSRAWTPSRQVTRVRETGEDGMDDIPHPKHSVTLSDNPFLTSPCPKPSIFCAGTWDLQRPCTPALNMAGMALCCPSKLRDVCCRETETDVQTWERKVVINATCGEVFQE